MYAKEILIFRSGLPQASTKISGKSRDHAHYKAKVSDFAPKRKLLVRYQKKEEGSENVNLAILVRLMGF